MPLLMSATHGKGNILDTFLLSAYEYQTHLASVLKDCLISEHHPILTHLHNYETVCPFSEKNFL